MVEGRHQLDVPREQHAVAEHVARHVADAHDREVLRLRVVAPLAEVALHALPRAARRDAHLLVVVAGAAARGEGVREPEAVLGRDAVRVVGEGGRALVGRDDEVRIVRVVAHDAPGRHDLAGDEVVRHVEQAPQEVPVAGDALGEERLALRGRRGGLQHEAALGAHGNDDGVLHHLRLHEAEDLRAEVLGPVRPAKAAARDLAPSQVNGLEPRRVHEHLEERARLGQFRHLGRFDLEGQVGLALPAIARHPVVGAHGGADGVEEAAQDAILVEVRHTLERGHHFVAQALFLLRTLALEVGIEAGVEDRGEARDDGRVRGEGLREVGEAEGEARLLQVLGIGAEHDHVIRARGRGGREAVEGVVLDLALHHPQEGFLRRGLDRLDVGNVAAAAHAEVVEEDAPASRAPDLPRDLVQGLEAQVLEDGQAARERHARPGAVNAKAQGARVGLDRAIERHRVGLARAEAVQHGDVPHRHARVHRLAVGDGKRIGPERGDRLVLAGRGREGLAQVVLPAAGGERDLRLDGACVGPRLVLRRGAHQHVDAGEHRVRELQVVLGARALQVLQEHRLDLEAHVGVVALARQVDEAGPEAPVHVAAQEDARAAPVAQSQDAQRDLEEGFLVHLEELVARVRLQHRHEVLVAVRGRGKAGALDDAGDLAAQQGHGARVGMVGRARVEPHEAALAGHAAGGVEAFHADVVEVAGAVDGGAGIGLREHERARIAREGLEARRQLLEARRHAAQAGLAQHAQARARDDAQHVLAAHVRELVVAKAQEREVIVDDPREEFAHLRRLGLVHALGHAGELLHDLFHASAHGRPVLDRRAHVGQHRGEAVAQGLEPCRVRLPVHLHVDVGLAGTALAGRGEGLELSLRVAPGARERVHQQVHGAALSAQFHRDGVDEEGHVVVHDLDHGVRRTPAMLLGARVVDAQLGAPGVEAAREGEVGERGSVQVLGRAPRQVLGIHLVVVEGNELAGLGGGGGRQARAGELQHGFENGAGCLGSGRWHEGLVIFMTVPVQGLRALWAPGRGRIATAILADPRPP